MPKSSSVFVCQKCEFETPRWAGQCPNCREWNTLVETTVLRGSAKKHIRNKLGGVAPIRLSDVQVLKGSRGRLASGIGELDRVLGGGIVPGSVVLVAGQPGIGKSTLLTQLALQVAGTPEIARSKKGRASQPRGRSAVLYVCGEESPGQVRLRAQRLAATGSGRRLGNPPQGRLRAQDNSEADVLLLAETDVDVIVQSIENEKDSLSMIIVDSVQSLSTEDLSGMAGSVGQVRESAERLRRVTKRFGIPIFLVGHVTKTGSIAGPKVLEHLVDVVLDLTGERTGGFRILRAVKNRFGATDEVGVFEMADAGMQEVTNPSKAFLEESQQGVPGSVVVAVMEGTRPVLVEIQALVVPSQLAMPRRVAQGISVRKIQLLAAVLQKRCNLSGLGTSDIFVNVAGGIQVVEPAADLGIALAIASSLLNKPVSAKTAIIGEVGLLGEVRKVAFLDKRVKEAKKLGYRTVVTPGTHGTLLKAVKGLGG